MYLKKLSQKWLIVGQWLSKVYYFFSREYCIAIKMVYLKKFSDFGKLQKNKFYAKSKGQHSE